jgi:hypothetical protein
VRVVDAVRAANVALGVPALAGDLVAALVLDKRHLALGTLADNRLAQSLLPEMDDRWAECPGPSPNRTEVFPDNSAPCTPRS